MSGDNFYSDDSLCIFPDSRHNCSAAATHFPTSGDIAMLGKLWTWRNRSSHEAAAKSEPLAEKSLGGGLSLLLGTPLPLGDDWIKQIEALRTKSERGDRDAQCDLALALWKGRYDSEHCNESNGYVPPDIEGALRWWHEAAERGDTRAQANLAYLYFSGRNIPFDGSPVSAISQDEHQKKVSGQAEEAKKWLRLAANGGHVNAQFVLGWMHWTQAPSSKDPVQTQARKLELAEASKWFQKAAEQGHAEAQAFVSAQPIPFRRFDRSRA